MTRIYITLLILISIYFTGQPATAFQGGSDTKVDVQTAASKNGLCEAVFRDGYWNVTSSCADDCRCMTPPLSSNVASPANGTVPDSDTFGCEEESRTDANAQRFFLKLNGEYTGVINLGFDSSAVDKFDAFKIRVIHPTSGKAIWKITATWNVTGIDPGNADVDMTCDPTHKACAVLTCDSPRFGDQSYTGTFAAKTPKTIKFGNWEVELVYLPVD